MPRFINDLLINASIYYRCIISRIRKNGTISFMKNTGLTKNSEALKNIKIIITYKNGLKYLNI